MKLSLEELDRFHSFAVTTLESDGEISWADLVQRWQALREYEEAVKDIRRGVRDCGVGRGEAFRNAMAGIRDELGLP